jgi:hypothetical protein
MPWVGNLMEEESGMFYEISVVAISDSILR